MKLRGEIDVNNYQELIDVLTSIEKGQEVNLIFHQKIKKEIIIKRIK